MTRCIIHIGMHKTGSTSIQNSLHGFSDDRFVYADLGKSPNHSLAIYSLFAARPERHHLHRAKGWDAAAAQVYVTGIRSDLERAIAAARGRTLLISGEDISLLPQTGLVKLCEYFRTRVDDLAIVGYVRPPAGYMASAFQQRVRSGSLHRLDLERQYHDYKERFAKFDEIFGRENVRLWKFDPKIFPGSCAVRDFCSRLDISLPGERIVRLNESLSRQAVALFYTYHKWGRNHGARTMRGPEGLRLGALLAAVGNDRFRFSPDAVRPVLGRHRADIEWMEARLGQSLHEELGEHQAGDVRDEADLLAPDPGAVSTLLRLLGSCAPAGVMGGTPEEVAVLIHALRTERVPERGAKMGGVNATREHRGGMLAKSGSSQVKVTELIDQMHRRHPKLLDGIPEIRAEALVRGVFKQINDTLAETEDGVMKYAGLGQFRVRQVEREVDGKKVSRTQIMFRRANPARGSNADGVESEV